MGCNFVRQYDVSKIGYPIANNMEQLLHIINTMEDYDFSKICRTILDNYGTNETGHASEEVCKRIISFIEGEK